jgi:16S rRNA (guanine527-N7)-methyltransferase
MNPEFFSQLYTTLSWSPQPIQQEQFIQLYGEILRGNRQFNLTRITDEDAFWEKHIWDSLSGLCPWLSGETAQPQRGIDIGTGAGFPGIVAAIVLPQTQITLLDSTRKKITFLQDVIQNLNLRTVTTIVDRVETLGQHRQHRSQYDLALIRAVGPSSVCAEYALPLLKQGGTAVLYRGQWAIEEEKHLSQVAQQLGAELKGVQAWTTPLTGGIRHCVYLQKVASTPNTYPRAIGVPSQAPL